MKKIIAIISVAVLLFLVAGCSSEGKANAPFNSQDCKGMNYAEVMDLLEAAGFTQVISEEIMTESPSLGGTVKSVVFGDMDKYSTGNQYAIDEPVIIEYYTLEMIEVSITLEIGGEPGKPEFTILTNLPDGADFRITLEGNGLYAEEQLEIKRGAATTKPFTNNGNELIGTYKIVCTFDIEEQGYFTKVELGTHGERLSGDYSIIDDETGNIGLYFEHQYVSDYTEPEKPEPIPLEEMDALLMDLLTQSMGKNVSISLEGSVYIINLWQDGLAATTVLAVSGNQEAMDVWADLRQTAAKLSVSLCEFLATNGHGDKFVTVNLLNDVNMENVLLTATLGVVTYDCTE